MCIYIYILFYVYICTLTRIYTFIFYTLILSLYIPREFNHPAPKRNPRGIKNGQIGIGAPNSTQIDVQLKVLVRPTAHTLNSFATLAKARRYLWGRGKKASAFYPFSKRKRRAYIYIYIYIYIYTYIYIYI